MFLVILSLLLGTILPIVFALGITMPFTGVLVRYRENCAPTYPTRMKGSTRCAPTLIRISGYEAGASSRGLGWT
ncbi:hypothetical protein B0H19DRAFT_1266794 [Mycena capillaripes]|nr:hypothetical protein B0H19DRAFT_1266794 [Mycena capillaripes]